MKTKKKPPALLAFQIGFPSAIGLSFLVLLLREYGPLKAFGVIGLFAITYYWVSTILGEDPY